MDLLNRSGLNFNIGLAKGRVHYVDRNAIVYGLAIGMLQHFDALLGTLSSS